MKKLILMATLAAGPAAAQGYTTLPDGETLYSPQPDTMPTRQYYQPNGGPPVGYTVQTPNVDIFYPYAGGPSYTIPRER